MDILQKDVFELSALLKKRAVSSYEITSAYLNAIQKSDDEIGAFISVCGEKALADALRADKMRACDKQISALCGIPIALKDNICTKGIRTSCGSKMLSAFNPPYSAHVYEALEAIGIPLLGKTNMDEFAMGSATNTSVFRTTHNPYDFSHTAGGSSGGSAAAVAANLAPFALGSDTGGSVRQPASFCGVVGMKPTYGTVSRFGLIAFASSLDQIGPITRTVRDNAMLLSAIASPDSRDATCKKGTRPNYLAMLGSDVRGLRFALPYEFFDIDMSPAVKKAVISTANVFESAGATIEYVSIPLLKDALAAYYIISSAEASSNLARYDGIRYGHRASSYGDLSELYESSRSEGFGDEVKRRILLGTFALSEGYYEQYYVKAQAVKTALASELSRLFESYSAIISPTAPSTAFKFEDITDPVAMYNGDIYTVSASLTGLPALSIPCGFDENAMPVGLQLIGKAYSEPQLYSIAHWFERSVKVDK